MGKRGDDLGEQVAISSSPLEGAPHASREGPQPPGAENLRPSNREMFVQSERWGAGVGSGAREDTQASSNSPNSSRIDRRSNRAGRNPDGLQSAHTEPDFVVTSRGLLGAKRVGVMAVSNGSLKTLLRRTKLQYTI